MHITNTELAALIVEIHKVNQESAMFEHREVHAHGVIIDASNIMRTIDLAALLRRADVHSHYVHIIQFKNKLVYIERFTKIGPNQWSFKLPREMITAK